MPKTTKCECDKYKLYQVWLHGWHRVYKAKTWKQIAELLKVSTPRVQSQGRIIPEEWVKFTDESKTRCKIKDSWIEEKYIDLTSIPPSTKDAGYP